MVQPCKAIKAYGAKQPGKREKEMEALIADQVDKFTDRPSPGLMTSLIALCVFWYSRVLFESTVENHASFYDRTGSGREIYL